jgi:transcriptional regulator with XRE-family HTH domain
MQVTLKAARVNAGLTQKEAAAKLGIDARSLAHYEKGHRYPSVPTIQKMEALYGVTYADIIFLPGDTVLQ